MVHSYASGVGAVVEVLVGAVVVGVGAVVVGASDVVITAVVGAGVVILFCIR